MNGEVAALAVALTLAIVFAWSGVVAAVDAAHSSAARLDERRERSLLAIMLAPTLFGVIAAFVGSVAPVVAFTFPNLESVSTQEIVETVTAVTEEKRSVDPWTLAAILAAGAYAAGAAAFVARLTAQAVRLRGIANRAADADGGVGEDVAITSEDVPPFASLSGRIVVPAELAGSLTPQQLAMIVEHERAHVRRGDTIAFLMLSLIDALFWIHPFIRRQTNRCRLAAEIACDAAVTGAAPEIRDDYAQTLLAVLKRASAEALPSAPTVFSVRNKAEHRIRMAEIIERVSPLSMRRGRAVLAGLAALLLPLAAAQVSIARTTSTHRPDFSVAPVDGVLASGFQEKAHPVAAERKELSNGVIINSEIGTPVYAPASGRVVLVMAHPAGYGDFVMIDHGGGYMSCFGPVAGVSLKKGDRIAAGDQFAQVGAGAPDLAPFIFIEIQRDGVRMDPAALMRIPGRRA